MRNQSSKNMAGDTREAYIRRAIFAKNLTITETAKRAGVPLTTLNGILSKGSGGTSFDTIVKICNVLSLDLNTVANGPFDLEPRFLTTK